MDRPGREFTTVDGQDNTISVATLAEVVASGEETETGDEEDRQDQTVITTDPFTRQDLVDQQKADDSLKPLFEAAGLGHPEYFVRDDVLHGENLQPKHPYKIVVPTQQRERENTTARSRQEWSLRPQED